MEVVVVVVVVEGGVWGALKLGDDYEAPRWRWVGVLKTKPTTMV